MVPFSKDRELSNRIHQQIHSSALLFISFTTSHTISLRNLVLTLGFIPCSYNYDVLDIYSYSFTTSMK